LLKTLEYFFEIFRRDAVNFDAAAKHRNQCIEQHNDAIIRSVIALASAFVSSFVSSVFHGVPSLTA
jgi:hypothetical protein